MESPDLDRMEAEFRRRTARYDRYDRVRGRLATMLVPLGVGLALLTVATAFGALDRWLVPDDFLRGHAAPRYLAVLVLGVMAAYSGVTGWTIRQERKELRDQLELQKHQ